MRLDRTDRRALALSALILWIGGFELLPGAHVALHDLVGAHHHGDPHGHSYADPAHDPHDLGHVARLRAALDGLLERRRHRSPKGAPDPVAVGAPEDPLGHGAHSVAHRDLATEPARLVTPTVPRARLLGQLARPRPPASPTLADDHPPRARGPPRTPLA